MYKFKNHPLIFVFNEKCACTTIKHIINDIENLYTIKDGVSIHNKSFNNVTLWRIINKLKDHHVIFFSRNPYKRFISGYSKIVNKNILQLRLIKNKSFEECKKILNGANITIEEWCNILVSIDKKYLDSHFLDQTYKIKELFKHKNIQVYDIENLNNISSTLKNFNIDICLNVKNPYKYKKPSIDVEIKNKIFQYYKQDFELLNYNKD
jgi:Zn-dependent metalloprotease